MNVVTIATANLKLIQRRYEIYFSQFYVPNECEECSIHIISDVIAVLSCY